MLWIKSFHIIFVASWFAGMVPPESVSEEQRLLLMARKLMRFTTLLMIPALVLGFVLWLVYGIGQGEGNGWMHAKLALVVLAIGYHHMCGAMLRKFEAHANQRSHLWFRWFNEVPVVLLTLTVILVVVKPF